MKKMIVALVAALATTQAMAVVVARPVIIARPYVAPRPAPAPAAKPAPAPVKEQPAAKSTTQPATPVFIAPFYPTTTRCTEEKRKDKKC